MGNVSTSIAHACAKLRHFQEACNHIVSETKHQDFWNVCGDSVSSYSYDDFWYFQFPREWEGGWSMSKDLRPLDEVGAPFPKLHVGKWNQRSRDQTLYSTTLTPLCTSDLRLKIFWLLTLSTGKNCLFMTEKWTEKIKCSEFCET